MRDHTPDDAGTNAPRRGSRRLRAARNTAPLSPGDTPSFGPFRAGRCQEVGTRTVVHRRRIRVPSKNEFTHSLVENSSGETQFLDYPVFRNRTMRTCLSERADGKRLEHILGISIEILQSLHVSLGGTTAFR